MEPPYFISVSIYIYFVTKQLITINLSWCEIGLLEGEMGFTVNHRGMNCELDAV